MHKLIKDIVINTNDIPEAGITRNFTVTGDEGASFILIVSDADGKYYNFSDFSFSTGHSPEKKLRGAINGNSFQSFIKFPSVAGEFYDIVLIADPSTDTLIQGKQVINKRINQLGNVTVTFALATTDHATNYATLPSNVTSTSSPANPGSVRQAIDWNIQNANTDAGGFGLIFRDSNTVDAEINDKAWYYVKTTTLDGAVSSSTSLVLDSTENIVAGMALYSGTGVTLANVLSVNDTTKTITVSAAQTISDGVTLTFRAIGLGSVNSVLNSNITGDVLRITGAVPVKTTVRGGVSGSTTITVNGTYGIPADALYDGLGVDNSGGNDVSSVSASSTAGSFVSSVPQTLKDTTTLKFRVASPKFLADSFSIQGDLLITHYPATDATIYLDLDLIIDPGAAS